MIQQTLAIWSLVPLPFLNSVRTSGNKDICLQKKLYMDSHSSIIYNNQKVKTTQMSSVWWMSEQNVAYGYVEYLAIKRREMQPATWMNLESIKLSERGQSKRARIVWFHLHEMSRWAKPQGQSINGCLGRSGMGVMESDCQRVWDVS